MTRTKDYKDFKNFKDQVVKKAEKKGYDEVFEEFESRFGGKFEVNEQAEKLEEVNRAYNLGRTKLGKSLYHLQEYGEKVKYNSAQFVDGLIVGSTVVGVSAEDDVRDEDKIMDNPISWGHKAQLRIENREKEMKERGICSFASEMCKSLGVASGLTIVPIHIIDFLESPKIYRQRKEDEKETMLAKIENY